jgi:hypothetical protein
MGSSACGMCVETRPANPMRFDIRGKRVSQRSRLFSRLRLPGVCCILSSLPHLRNDLHDQCARVCGLKTISVLPKKVQ